MSVQNTPATVDNGRIRVGAAFRLVPSAIALPSVQVTAPNTADSGRIRVGAAFRLLAKA